MQGIDLSALDELDRRFERALQEIPGARRELHTRIADALEWEMKSQIGASGFSDGGAKLEDWQKSYVGTGGGYAAVRPKGSADGVETGPNGPGAITNYNENGHRIRPASGNAKRLRKGRAKKIYVEGQHFYAQVNSRLESLVIGEAEQYMESIAGKLGDE